MTVSSKSILIGIALTVIFLSGVFFLVFHPSDSISNRTGFVMDAQEIASFDVAKETAYLRTRIRALGAAAAYEELVKNVATLSPLHQHIYGHSFGEALYDEKGFSGIAICDERLYSGCMHQIIGRAITDYGTAIVPQLLTQCTTRITMNAAFACENGIGHGVLASLGYTLGDLEQALNLCRKDAPDTSFLGQCELGVFTEYNTRSLSGEISVRPLPTTGDYYFPCTELPSSDTDICVRMLPHWWLYLSEATTPLGTLFTDAGARCRALSPPLASFQDSCFSGIGDNVARATDFNRPDMVLLCKNASASEHEETLCNSAADAFASVINSPL